MRKTMAAVTTLLVLALGLPLTACSPAIEAPAQAAATHVASAPEQTTTAPGALPADSPVGTNVPSDQIDAFRGAGGHVYVGGDGAATVVEFGQPLPDVVVADVKQGAGPATSPQNTSARRPNLTAAGMYVLALVRTGSSSPIPLYVVRAVSDIPGLKEYGAPIGGGALHDTKEAAIAEMQPFVDANPGVIVVDLTL
jgi:hypothetical protein